MASPLTLFDQCNRTNAAYRDRTEQDFAFLNRSADPRFEAIRAGIESWFARLPEDKKKDIRGRFRGDNGPHSGALLELITHEFLNAIGACVKLEPNLNGLTPDFEATIDDARVLFECTVTHPLDQEVSADKREARIKKALDSIDTGRFTLGTEFVEQGDGQPSLKHFKYQIKHWLTTLDPDDGTVSTCEWNFGGWKVIISAWPFKPGIYKQEGERAVGVETDAEIVDADHHIRRALRKKATKYKASERPYVIVISHRFDHVSLVLNGIYTNSIVDALYGPIHWVSSSGDLSDLHEERHLDGLFGSVEKPKNQRVSAVLFKREITVTRPSVDLNPDPFPPWVLYHHPWAKRPLPRGLFPFAADVDVTKTPQIAHPTCNLWELLKLPIIGKDKYSLKGGMWEAIVG